LEIDRLTAPVLELADNGEDAEIEVTPPPLPEALIVIAPVLADRLIPVPADRLVTPVLVKVILPVEEDAERPVPAVMDDTPLAIVDAHAKVEPFHVRYSVLPPVGAVMNEVEPEPA
jgi:hypothetical protein